MLEKIKKLEEELAAVKKVSASSVEDKVKLETQLTEFKAKAKADADAAEKVQVDSAKQEVETFCDAEDRKEWLTPALKSEMVSLAEVIGHGEMVIKLDEEGTKTEKIAAHKALTRFAENLIKAKKVMLGEKATSKKKGGKNIETNRIDGADYADLDEKAQALVASDSVLSKLAETQPNAAYMTAVNRVSKETPELAQRGGLSYV